MGEPSGSDNTNNIPDELSYHPDRFYSAPKSGIGGILDPTGEEVRTPTFDTRQTISQYSPGAGTGLNANYVDVPNPNYGQQVGYTSDANMPGVMTALGTMLNGGKTPQVYTGDNRFNPFGDPTAGNPGDDGGGFYNAAATVDPLAAARQRRAEAYNSRNSALTEAFGGFNDDYYSDLETAFRDVNTPGVQSQYDDAMRGIYQGFKQQGIFDQSDFDSRVAALDSQRTAEEARIGTAAKDYAEQQRKAIADQQSKLAKSLSGIMGGANTLEEIDAQTNNIGQFSFDSDIAKLKAAGPDAPSMDMFADFTKVAAPTLTGAAPANVAPISPSAFGGASQLVNTGGGSGSSTGVASPFSGSSVKVL